MASRFGLTAIHYNHPGSLLHIGAMWHGLDFGQMIWLSHRVTWHQCVIKIHMRWIEMLPYFI